MNLIFRTPCCPTPIKIRCIALLSSSLQTQVSANLFCRGFGYLTWLVIIRSSQASQIFLKCFSFFVGDNQTISGQPNAPTGTWNPGLEVSVTVATSPEPGHPRRRSQGEQQGPPQMNQRRSGEEDVIPEEETDSETAPAMTSRLQRQQSSMLLLEKVILYY